MAKTDAIQIRQRITGDGAILFDAAYATQAGEFEPNWFEPGYWRERGLATTQSGGRGSVTFVAAPCGGVWVLRHYRRGGFVAPVLGDRYLWNGAEQTRSFVEFRLLAELVRRGIDVAEPIAARYQRSGVHYRADLITMQIPNTQTLAQYVASQSIDVELAQRVGAAIAALHAAGAYHADLNAHNVLLDAHKAWIIDFDRSELRTPQRAWQLANLARLKRSLIKLGALGGGEAAFERNVWQPLLSAYDRALGAMTATDQNSGVH
jgi:3-deoxy-D-manno-octulosonic acid kinase